MRALCATILAAAITRFWLSVGSKIADLMLVGESKIDLNGHVLTISDMQHKDRAGWDPAGAVVDSVGTGEIAWVALAGLMIIVK